MGGEAKARGTREERVAQALKRKELENVGRINSEIAFCYHQRYFEDNIKLFSDDIEREKKDDYDVIVNYLPELYKTMLIGKISKREYGMFRGWPFISITIKRETKYIFKIIYETIYGIASVSYSKNGTAGWILIKSVNDDILDKCYDRIGMLRYVMKKS